MQTSVSIILQLLSNLVFLMIDIPASNIALVFMSVGVFFSDLDFHVFPKT